MASLAACLPVLLWSVMPLVAIITSSALAMASVMAFYIDDKYQLRDNRLKAFEYFGNFPRALLSMFEITLGNWAPITRFLQDNVTEWFGFVLMVYHCVVAFAVV